MSQNQKIKNHLLKGKPITPIEALNKFGCFRLAARINDLINDGIDIKSDLITKNGKKFAKYYL
jgi:hypothetical protein